MALYQEAVEKYIELAEKALPGLNARVADEVDETVRTPLFELAGLLATVVQPRILRPWPDRDLVVGVALARLKRDGAPYTMILRTHSRVGAPAEHALLDGLGPPPEAHLDGFRFLGACSGLLRIVEAEVRGLIESKDFNWDEDWEGEVEHPEDMLKRVRGWRREARGHLVVDQVHAL
jgi:hypothetical protein